jgi:butyryl-CoA dehydrogenase
MDFALNKEQLMIQQMVREFAVNEIEPIAAEYEAEGRFPEEIIKGLSDLGIMGMTVPKEYGGGGCDTVSYTVAVEEIARACASTAIAVSVNNSLACFPEAGASSTHRQRGDPGRLRPDRALGGL